MPTCYGTPWTRPSSGQAQPRGSAKAAQEVGQDGSSSAAVRVVPRYVRKSASGSGNGSHGSALSGSVRGECFGRSVEWHRDGEGQEDRSEGSGNSARNLGGHKLWAEWASLSADLSKSRGQRGGADGQIALSRRAPTARRARWRRAGPRQLRGARAQHRRERRNV